MSASRWERGVPLAGVVFALLIFIGFGLIGQVGRTSTPSAEQIDDLLTDRAPLRLFGVYLSLVAIPFLVLFSGRLYSSLRIVGSGTRWLSMVSFAGGVVAAAPLLVGFAAIGQATIRADSAEGLGPDSAIVFYDLYRSLLTASAMGFAIFIGAAAVESYRTRAFPRWLSWTSGAVAIGLVSPLFFFFVFIAIIWVLAVSVWLFREALRSPTSTPSIAGTAETGL